MTTSLSQFTITRAADGTYVLHIETDDGETMEIEATYDQLDLLAEAIDEQLDNDEEDALGLDDDIDPNVDVEELGDRDA